MGSKGRRSEWARVVEWAAEPQDQDSIDISIIY